MVKFHIGVDSESGLVHTLKVTSGNVRDIAEAASLLHGEEQFVHGDAGYQARLAFLVAIANVRVGMPTNVVA
ncbi:transposase [Methylomonas defluvii]|uniref:transposase n=1 Tax=Methylomonas defluvii TaxID=3045149 RepID=UPI003CC693FB